MKFVTCKVVIKRPSRELSLDLCTGQNERELAKIKIASQSERSDPHKVPRRMREQWQNSHRGLPHQRERSDAHKLPRGLREHMLDSHKILRAPGKSTLKMSRTRLYHVSPRSKQLVCRGLQSLALATKNGPEASEVLPLPHGIFSSCPS